MQNLIDLALPYQRDFITSPKKKKIWLSSRQAGKSWSLAFLANWKALSKKNGLSLCISTGARAASELIKKCEQMAYAIKLLSNGALNYTASADSIRWTNGARILSLPSGNPAGLRGYTAAATLIDECAYIDRPYDVYAAIVPTLTRDPSSELIIASTPAGKHGLFWDLWNTADDTWYKQCTTIEEAKSKGLDVDIEALKRMVIDQDIFDMEYMCQFADSFSEFIDLNAIDYVDEIPPEAKTHYLGMDVGSTSDRTAIVTLAQHNETFYLKDIAIMHKASYESQLDILKQLHQANQYIAGLVDQNGIGSALAEFATKQVTSKIKGFTWTSANKTPAYEALRAAMFDHKLKVLRRWKPVIELDFQNVHRIVNEAGKVSFEAGRNSQGHSDVTSALVLALQAAKSNPASFSQPVGFQRTSPFGTWSSRLC